MSTQAIEKAPAAKATLQTHLESDRFKQQLAAIIPKHQTPERMVRAALTATMRSPLLLQCDQASFFQAMLTLGQLGLEPDGRRAHLIPFKNNKRGCYEVQLIVDYKGLVELAYNSGMVSRIHVDIVCENDVFEYDRGEVKTHKIDLRKPRGEIYAAYSLVRLKDGSESCEVMSKDEIDKTRARSRASGNGPWVDHYAEMAKKTVFRRHSKWLRLSPELREAVEADDDQFEEKRFEAAKPVFAPSMFSPAPEAIAPPEPEPSGEQLPPPPAPPEPKPDAAALRSELAKILSDAGFTWKDVTDWSRAEGAIEVKAATIEECPDETIAVLVRSKQGLLFGIKKVKGL